MTTRQNTSEMALDFERHLWDAHPGLVGDSKLNLLICPRDPAEPLKPVNLPLEHGAIQRFSQAIPGTPPRFAAAIAGMAWIFGRLDPAQMRAAIDITVEPGDRLVLASVIADTVSALPRDIPSYATSIEQDVPEDRQVDLRSYFAADGMGNGWRISRDPATGQILVEDEHACYPVPGGAIGAQSPPPEGDTREVATGLIPWALGTLCFHLRPYFDRP